MADGTKIEWTDATWNPIVGCSVLSPGCTNCYAMRLAGTRLKHVSSRAGLTRDSRAGPVWTGETRFDEKALTHPLAWRRPRKIFVCAHSDLFHEATPDAWVDQIFAVMALCPHHTFQVLTKRPERMRSYIGHTEWPRQSIVSVHRWWWDEDTEIGDLARRAMGPYYDRGEEDLLVRWPLPNVWLGITAVDQIRADERRDHMAVIAEQGWTTFVSQEPALGLIDWAGWDFLKLLISGGEGGPKARPAHPDWFRASRDWCASTGVAYFHKQNGEFSVAVDRGRDDPDWRLDYSRKFDDRHPYKWLNLAGGCGFHGERFHVMQRVGKARAGRLLDGIEHNQFPEG